MRECFGSDRPVVNRLIPAILATVFVVIHLLGAGIV
jgi:hypothetical protein